MPPSKGEWGLVMIWKKAPNKGRLCAKPFQVEAGKRIYTSQSHAAVMFPRVRRNRALGCPPSRQSMSLCPLDEKKSKKFQYIYEFFVNCGLKRFFRERTDVQLVE